MGKTGNEKADSFCAYPSVAMATSPYDFFYGNNCAARNINDLYLNANCTSGITVAQAAATNISPIRVSLL
jgi:hypothetical protein